LENQSEAIKPATSVGTVVAFRQVQPRQHVAPRAQSKPKVIAQDEIVEYQVLLSHARQLFRQYRRALTTANQARERIEIAFTCGLPVEEGFHKLEFIERIRKGKKCPGVEIL
jgi:hypothetical protein